jgi:hypothetical protein
MFYQLQVNPVSCGEFCSASSVKRTEYDVDDYRAISQCLVRDQSLSKTAIKYIQQSFSIYCEATCQSLPMADFYELGTAKIVSKKLKDIFGQIGVNAEYVSINIINRLNDDVGNYYLAHFKNIYDCFDYERSKYKLVERKSGKRPTSLKFLEIDQSKVNDNSQLFRVKYFENRILVPESLVSTLNNFNLRGILYLPLPVDEFDSTKLIHQLELDCSKEGK